MKERPIIFSGELVKAILEGRKTITRRVVKPQPLQKSARYFVFPDDAPKKFHDSDDIRDLCPFGSPGDHLWVRETWYPCVPGSGVAQYKADADCNDIKWHSEQGHRWRSPIHMPRWASRLTLEITGVRVERLQEISEEDAAAEGSSGCFEKHLHYDGREFRCSFERLWDSINATRPGHSWESNPWVWCLSFKRCENEKTL